MFAVPHSGLVLCGQESVYGAVVEDALFAVAVVGLVRFGPHVSVQLGVLFASWTRAAGKVGVFLHKCIVAYCTVNPGHIGMREQ